MSRRSKASKAPNKVINSDDDAIFKEGDSEEGEESSSGSSVRIEGLENMQLDNGHGSSASDKDKSGHKFSEKSVRVNEKEIHGDTTRTGIPMTGHNRMVSNLNDSKDQMIYEDPLD